VWTPYIAELWNSLSSVLLIIMGIYGMVAVPKTSKERRFMLAYFCLAVVGFGSTAFHATLRRWGQFMDELPMLGINHVFLYCQLRNSYTSNKTNWRGRIITAMLIFSALASSYSYMVLGDYNVFLLCYNSGLIIQVFIIIRILRKDGTKQDKFLLTVSACSYLSGFCLWIIERLYCEETQIFQLHAIWHIGAGFGTYVWILLLMSVRTEALRSDRKPLASNPVLIRWMSLPDKFVNKSKLTTETMVLMDNG